jgi:hypothetical protein
LERLCLDCGHLVRGRSDKKFCNDGCRNNFNNRVKSEDNVMLKKINIILKKNRSILAYLNPQGNGKVKVSKQKLETAGFHFDYHTFTSSTQSGKSFIFCYEYGYQILKNDEFLIIKREEQM